VRSISFAFADQKRLQETDELLATAERVLAESAEPSAWQYKAGDEWVMFQRNSQILPRQGWKLHISATPLSAARVLEAALPALFRDRCSFKIARSKRILAHLNDAHAPRGSSGKFMTIYPSDDEAALRLARQCHAATNGLSGPAILSNRACWPGSLVHYRYGGFIGETIYDVDGRIVHVVRDPNGDTRPDTRSAWFEPPSWVRDPFRNQPCDRNPASVPSAVWLHDGRYEVVRALRHANKGGVYLARDRDTNEEVVIKESRPHVCADRFGRDAIDRLRREAANLQQLASCGVVPASRGLFEEGGHLFLVLERMPGPTLMAYRSDRPGPLARRELFDLARSLGTVLEKCHQAGLVVRDFNPNNLIVMPDGTIRVIDVEMACAEGDDRPIDAFTPGFASPQQRAQAVPRRSDDDFSLAATLFFLATGANPYLVPDQPPRRPDRDRLADRLYGMIRDEFIPPELATPILGGMREDPTERWSAARILAELTTATDAHQLAGATAHLRKPGQERSRKTTVEARATVEDLISHALRSIDIGDGARPIRSSCYGAQLDPCNVQSGAAGVGTFLLAARAFAATAIDESIVRLAHWVVANTRQQAGRPQGLYFGLAGAAWFMLDVAESLGLPEVMQSACHLAEHLHSDAGQFDVTHGASGVGITLLHFYRASGRADFLDRAERLAQHVMSAAQESPSGLVWPRSGASGRTPTPFYGFAHGNAGIAYFLLAVHAATGKANYLAASEAAAAVLLDAVHVENDCAYWAHGPEKPVRWTYWCNGSSGIATTLVRLFQVTREARYRRLAEMAAGAVYAQRWHSSLCQCHGLAGNGELLMDLHRVLGEDQYKRMADQVVEVLLTHRVYQDGLAVFADDSGAMVSPDFGVGTSGIGAFLHRWLTGRPRLFMVDDVFVGPPPRQDDYSRPAVNARSRDCAATVVASPVTSAVTSAVTSPS